MDWIVYFIASIICVIAIFMLARLISTSKQEEHVNSVHFYVARDMDGVLCLYISKPFRGSTNFCPNIRNGVIVLTRYNCKRFGLNEDDYANLKWEDEPVEVFINIED